MSFAWSVRAKVNQNKRPEFCTNSGLSDARRQAASLSPSAACRRAFAKGAGKCFYQRERCKGRYAGKKAGAMKPALGARSLGFPSRKSAGLTFQSAFCPSSEACKRLGS